MRSIHKFYLYVLGIACFMTIMYWTFRFESNKEMYKSLETVCKNCESRQCLEFYKQLKLNGGNMELREKLRLMCDESIDERLPEIEEELERNPHMRHKIVIQFDFWVHDDQISCKPIHKCGANKNVKSDNKTFRLFRTDDGYVTNTSEQYRLEDHIENSEEEELAPA